MSRKQKYMIGAAIALVVFTLTGFFIVPPVAKYVVIKKASEALHRKVAIRQIKLNPYALALTVRGLSIEDPGRSTPFLAFDEFYVNVNLSSSIYHRALILEKIYETGLYVGVTRKKDGTYNFTDLIPKDTAKKEEPKKESKPFLFSLNNIQLVNGKIEFRDESCDTNHTIRDLNLAVPFVSNIQYYQDTYVEPMFSAIVNDHTVGANGKTLPFKDTHTTLFNVDVKDLDIPYYLKYVPAKLNVKLKSLRVDTTLKIVFSMGPKKSPDIDISGKVALRKLILDDLNDGKILHLPSLTVDIASVKPMIQNIHLASVAITSPDLVLIRNKKGVMNILDMVSPSEKKTPKETAESSGTAEPEAEHKSAEKKQDLVFHLDQFLLDKADIAYIDQTTKQPVSLTLSPLTVKATGLTLDENAASRITLDGTLNKTSRIAVEGPLVLNPLKMNFALSLEKAHIRPFQPYFTDAVKIDITRGNISTAGNFSLAPGAGKQPEITYTGNISVDDIATLDKAKSRDFLKWKSLAVNQINVGVNPFYLKIKSVGLSNYYAKIAINPDRTTNLQDIFNSSEPAKPGAAKAGAKPKETAKAKKESPKEKPADIRIGKVTFKNGTLDFADKSITPNFSTRMLKVGGSVTGLSSQNMTSANVALKGELGAGAPIDIGGKISPLTQDFFADIRISFKNIETSPTTPYTNKYLAYPIEKGKLNLELAYLIDKRKLDSQNKVLIDQLTFGDKVDSKDAIKVPAPLAVTLLSDTHGQIKLDIPVSGSLDDPKFAVWPIVWDVIKNLITKAALAPFKLLASLTGGGEEMSYVEFPAGSAAVTPPEQKKIDSLVKVMVERPLIKMDIEGYVDADSDTAGMKKDELNHRIKALKFKELLSRNEQKGSVDQVALTPEERHKYLGKVYAAEPMDKPKTSIGTQKDIPDEEKEKLLLANIRITDNELRELAARRAQAVKELLLKPGTVPADRLFIVEPKGLKPDPKDKVKDNRVDFKLK